MTAKPALWTSANRATTVGILMLITIAAFEQLGVSTAMPALIADLRGERLYSWPFTAVLAASVVATVLGGRFCDRYGPARPLLVGPALFLVGLLTAGTAHGMPLLLTGRVLQGLGLGIQIVAIYVLVAIVYPERDRAAVFGLVAAAWVVPAAVGPTLAGLVTENFGWRWVFLGIAPVVPLGVLLMVPAVRTLPPAPPPNRPARRGLPAAAVAAGIGLAALTWAAQHPSLGTAGLAVVGIALLAVSLRTLLPSGTLRARPGLPMVVLARGMFAGAFFAVEVYVPLTLTAVHHYPPALAGLPLTAGAFGWASASSWQGKHLDVPRLVLVRRGFLVVAAGLAGMVLVAAPWGIGWLAAVFWFVAGAGMGLAFPCLSVLSMEYAAPDERGFASAALQVSDMMGSAAMIGFGGVLLGAVASAAAPTVAVIPIDLLMAGLALLGALLVRRMSDQSGITEESRSTLV